MNWFRKLFLSLRKPAQRSASSGARPQATVSRVSYETGIPAQAQAYLDKVNQKIQQLGEDFANGKINRTQFKELYAHYQREIRSVSTLAEENPSSWADGVKEGASVFIKRQHMARAKAYAIYENASGMPLATMGEFVKDPGLVVPMLSTFRSVTSELFGAGIRTTQVGQEGWLVFVPGEYTTLFALFTNEPAGLQLKFMDDLHRLFESANAKALQQRPVKLETLIFPHEYYLGSWKT